MKIQISIVSPVVSYIRPADDEAIPILREFERWMKRRPENYLWHPAYKSGRWDGYLSFYSLATGQIYTGLIPLAYRMLQKTGAELFFHDQIGQFKRTNLQIDPEIFADYGYTLYDDQVKALNDLLMFKRGLGEICTGAGKTIMTCALLETIQPEKGLIIVPDINLVQQTYEEGFCEVGLQEETGMFFGQQKDYGKKYIIATWQSLNKASDDFLQSFDAVVVDECHGTKGKVIQSLLMKATNAMWRYGVTGTLPKNDCDRFTIEGMIGPKLTEITTKELQDIGRLTQCKIYIVNFEYTDRRFLKDLHEEGLIIKKSKPNQPGARRRYLLERLSRYAPRIQAIASLIKKLDGMSIVLTNYTEEGRNLVDHIEKSQYMDGSTPPAKRKEIRQGINKREIDALVTSYQMGSTGLNFKHLTNVIMASPTKSFVRTIQSIGRSLRRHHDKEQAVIVDINDKIVGVESVQDRIKFYEEKGFPIEEITIKL